MVKLLSSMYHKQIVYKQVKYLRIVTLGPPFVKLTRSVATTPIKIRFNQRSRLQRLTCSA